MKKIPLRTCIGCRSIKPKGELIRIVKGENKDISIDKTGKKNGRGAYICPSRECLAKAIKNKRLSREFEMEIPNKVYENLDSQIGEEADDK